MKIDLTGKVAVVTGGSRGLGECMASMLAECGATVALVARDEAKLKGVADAIRAAGGKAEYFLADVTNEADVVRMAGEVEAQLGPANILINNAGTNVRKALVDLTTEEFMSVINSSLLSTFLVSRAFVPGMKGTGYGRIINMTSMLSHISLANRTPYSSAKTALLGFIRSLALELAGENITVNGISPGPVGTEMNHAVMNDPVANAHFLASLPVGRWGEVEEIAALDKQDRLDILPASAAADPIRPERTNSPAANFINGIEYNLQHIDVSQFGDYSTAQLHLWVERFFRLWCRNQWKRERYAPSFHLDDENLDPKTWCRFPILSSGFTAELAEMRDWSSRQK